MKEKVIEIIKKYFPKKEILENASGFQIEDHVNDMFIEGNAKLSVYTAYYNVSYSEQKRKTFLYKIEVTQEEQEPIIIYIEVSSIIKKNTIRRMVTDISNIGNDNAVQVDTEGRKGLALVAFCAHTIEKEIKAIPVVTEEDKEISNNVIEGIQSVVRNFMCFREAVDGISYLKTIMEENVEPTSSFSRELIDLHSQYDQAKDFARKEYESHGDEAIISRIRKCVYEIENAESYEDLLDSIEELAKVSISYASLKKFKV